MHPNIDSNRNQLNISTDFSDALKAEAETMQLTYNKLHDQFRRVRHEIERVKTYVEHLNGLLEAKGMPRISLHEPTAKTGIGRPGNRTKGMPLRRSEWEDMSVMDAVDAILRQTDKAVHADVLVERIYEVTTPLEHKKAKHTLASTARQGAKNDRWIALGRNRYQAKDQQREMAVS